MLNIKVLGPGCANCVNLMKNAQAAAEQLGVEATFEKLTDWSQFVPYGLRATPGLVVNEKLLSSGRVPTAAEIATLLATVLSQN
ncbi:MAG TPA: thioredoxin family protein [Anaerolineae bacterium]